jgi:hypothetical protein
MIFSACPKSLLAAGNDWTEIEIDNPHVRLFSIINPNLVKNPTKGLVNFAIQVFSDDDCRTVNIIPHLNEWSRSAMPIGDRIYRTGFYKIGFLAPLANTPNALGREGWTFTATVSDVQECPL